MNGLSSRLVILTGALALGLSGPASAAAQAAAPVYSPWAALSAFATQASSQALCGSAASAAQANAPGCVLPQTDVAPVPAGEAASPVAAAAASTPGAGIGILPLILGLAAVAGIAALIVGGGGDNDSITLRPVSP